MGSEQPKAPKPTL